VASKDDCHICGKCYWHDCPNEADFTVDVDLKRHGLPLYSGGVDLCAGHYRFARRGNHMDLNWMAVEQALEREMKKRPKIKAQTL
jgi:hypothetical protein